MKRNIEEILADRAVSIAAAESAARYAAKAVEIHQAILEQENIFGDGI